MSFFPGQGQQHGGYPPPQPNYGPPPQAYGPPPGGYPSYPWVLGIHCEAGWLLTSIVSVGLGVDMEGIRHSKYLRLHLVMVMVRLNRNIMEVTSRYAVFLF